MIGRPDWERTEDERKMCKALEDVAQQVGAKSIQAGESHHLHRPRRIISIALAVSSRYRLCDAQDDPCLPNHRRT